MSIFHHVRFAKVDPLANGLADEIAAEQREADAINSLEDTSPEDLEKFWSGVVEDIKKDPQWSHFTEE